MAPGFWRRHGKVRGNLLMAYRGTTVQYPLGNGGFNGIRNRDLIPLGHLAKARNVRFETSSIVKAGGLALYDSNAIAATPNCLAGHDWHPTAALQRQVTAWANGDVYKEVSGDQDSVTWATGLTLDKPIVFVEGGQETATAGNRKLYMYMEGIPPREALADAGASGLAEIANTKWPGGAGGDWSADGPAGAIWHDYRIFAFGHPTYPHTIYTSNLDDHADFTAGEPSPPIFQVSPGSAERISALASDFQTGSRDLYVFKYPKGIFRINTTSIVSAYISTDTVTTDIGCPGPNAVAQVENDVWFIGQDGHIYSLASVISEQNVARADITELLNLEDWLNEFVGRTEAKLKFARILYDPKRKEVHVTYRGIGDSLGSVSLIVNVSQQNNPRIVVEDRGTYFEAQWLSRQSTGEDKLYTGGSGGVFYKANDGTITIGASTTYTSEFEIPGTDFSWVSPGLRDRVKRFDWFSVSVVDSGSGQLQFDFYIDGVLYSSDTADLTASGDALDTGVLDAFQLGGGLQMRTYKVKIGGFGVRFGAVIKSNDSEKFEIAGADIGFKPLGQKGEH